jgi:hypothetical protein
VVVVDGVKEDEVGMILKAKVDRVNIRELFGKRV